MANKMTIEFINGINGDRVNVVLNDKKYEYSYGCNCSATRAAAKISEKDHELCIKNNWSAPWFHEYKPFIGDLLADLIETNYILEDDITYTGYHVFSGEDMTEDEIKAIVKRIAEEV